MCSVNGATGSSGLVSLLGSDTGQGWECPGLSFSCYLFEHPCFCGMFQMDSVFEAEGRVGILRLSQRQCDLGGLLNKLNVYVCVAYSSACPETSENEGETVWESMEAFRAPGRGGERQSGGENNSPSSRHTPLDVIAQGCLLSCFLAGSREGRALQQFSPSSGLPPFP